MLRYIQSQTQWLSSGASVSQCTHWLRHISTHLHCHSTTTLRPFLHSKPGANDKSMGIDKKDHDKHLISIWQWIQHPPLRPSFGNHRNEQHHCRHTSQMGSACHQKTGATWLHLWMDLCRDPPWFSWVWALVPPLEHCVWSTLDHGCWARPTATGIRPAELSWGPIKRNTNLSLTKFKSWAKSSCRCNSLT